MVNAAWGTITYTSNAGYRAGFSFNGTRISLLYSMAYNRGNQSVFIDGVYRGSFSSYASSYTNDTRRQVIQIWDGLPAGDHTIEVRADSGLVDVDAFAVDLAAFGTGTYDDATTAPRFVGTWDALSGISGLYNGTMKRSQTGGDFARITFVGNQITWVFSRDTSRGIAVVTIDGVNKGSYNFYGSLQRQQTLPFTGLGSGVHTFHVTVTGTSQAGAIGSFVDVDDFIIQ